MVRLFLRVTVNTGNILKSILIILLNVFLFIIDIAHLNFIAFYIIANFVYQFIHNYISNFIIGAYISSTVGINNSYTVIFW